jgi:CRISPR-associated protein Cas1
VGLDGMLGFYHQPHFGRPSLALDLMEEFRPVLADSTVIGALNNGVIQSNDFLRAAGSVALTQPARKGPRMPKSSDQSGGRSRGLMA